MDENINTADIKETPVNDNSQKITVFRWNVILLLLSINIVVFIFIISLLVTAPLFVTTRKPAIYLYPDKTAQISVKLNDAIKYNNVIPKYKNGWYVEAEPNGFLRDLQPEFTKCDKLPYKEFGFEYSKRACEINKYPYIYWDGYSNLKPLPKKEVGFIVKTEDIETFLSQKADVIGFNESEKSEFVRYWSRKIKDTKWKTVRIYFLQNEEVDNYYPIIVEPEPNSSNRIQIVIEKAKRNKNIEEQNLIPIKRDGYTLVEWGGIIK